MIYQDYLTEFKLYTALCQLYPNNIINKQVTVPETRYRSDYVIHELKLVIEFNGFMHYTLVKTILRDRKVVDIWESLGYKVISIPYFVQLDEVMIKHYFNLENNSGSNYHHGFIDKMALLPDNYCTIELKRYYNELSQLPDEVSKSIKETCTNLILD